MEKKSFCHCGGPLEYIETEGQVCKACGTIEDSSYVQLVTHHDAHSSIHQGGPSAPLKGLRNNWHLSGQSREARHRANTLEMHKYIDSIACILHAGGLSTRATNIFDNAMSAGSFRWGRKAQMAAGAALSLALRESKRPGSLIDIARLLNENDIPNFERFVNSVKSILKLDLTASDSHAYIIALKDQMAKAIQEEPTSVDSSQERKIIQLLPAHRALLKSIDLDQVLTTGRSLLDLLGRQFSSPSELSPAPTACAAFLYAVETEARLTISHVPKLAGFIAQQCNLGKETVMRRYQSLEATLLDLTKCLPWLEQHEKPASRSSGIAKRLIIARGLKDVIEWQEEIWTKSLEQKRPPAPALQDDDDETSNDSGLSVLGVPRQRPAKEQRRHPLNDAKRFLIDPENAPLPTVPQNGECLGENSADVPLTAYILSGSSATCQSNQIPSRLQLLTVARGGSSAEEIGDEELFEAGEFENMLRSVEEKKSFLHFWTSNGGDEVPAAESPKAPRKKGKSKKINAEAAARFFDTENGELAREGKDDDMTFWGWENDNKDGEYDDYTRLAGEDELGIRWRHRSSYFHDGYQEEV